MSYRICVRPPPVDSYTTYGQWLKMHLDEMSVSHDWLAWRIDSSQSAVQQWANGKTVPTIRYFLRISRLIAVASKRPFTEVLLEAANCVDNQKCK